MATAGITVGIAAHGATVTAGAAGKIHANFDRPAILGSRPVQERLLALRRRPAVPIFVKRVHAHANDRTLRDGSFGT